MVINNKEEKDDCVIIETICDLYNEALVECNKEHAGDLNKVPTKEQLRFINIAAADQELAHDYLHDWCINWVYRKLGLRCQKAMDKYIIYDNI